MPWKGRNSRLAQHFLYRRHDLRAFFFELGFRPCQADGCRNTASHDRVADGKRSIGQLQEGLFLGLAELIKRSRLAEMIPFADIMPVMLVPVKITREDALFL